MRTIFLRSIAAAAACTIAVSASAGAVARWLETEHNFGAFDEEMGVATCEFKAVNDGDEPLVVVNARANCGCTRPSYSPEPVMPGDTLVITVGYDPEGRPGRFTKYIKVETNGNPGRGELKITGTVIGAANSLRSRYPIDLGAVKLRDKVVAYGEVLKGKTLGAYIEGYNATAEPITPRVDNLPPYITARIEPEIVPPGEQFIISTVAHSERTNQWGVVTGDFDFYPTDNAEPITLSAVMIIKEDFSTLTPQQRQNAPVADIEPTKLDLGRIDPSSMTSPLSASFEIKNSGNDPLIVRAIACVDNAVTIDNIKPDIKIKGGKSLKVTVKVDPAQLAGRTLLNARIIVTTNDPEDPSQTVRVVGEITK
ncbi:MAG: DUF1573 domain-containing protein [Muribaculaceae bacterium]|nr:DUF1573 domain-containing protein [Muribaculaceae bacterium]